MSGFDLQELKSRLSDSAEIITDFSKHDAYLQDATEEKGSPAAAVLAGSVDDVMHTARYANQHNLTVVPRGTGTGLSGGAVPDEGSIVVSVERLTNLRIDADKRVAVCGPGVITKDLLDAAAEHGLTYPPDPASYKECSLGGNIAENAGGLRCKRFGVTRDYVLGMKAVTPDGELLLTGCYNQHRGFALGDMLIGSEGTLAIVVEMTVRLIPIPKVGSTILVAFDNEENAGHTVAKITASGVIPTVLEYLDRDAVACSNRYEPTEGLDDAAALLLIETDGDRDIEQCDRITTICRENRSSYYRMESDPKLVEELWQVRRNLSKAVRDVAKFRYNEDVAVPVSGFMSLIRFVAELNASSPLRVNAFGHAGDGNLHVSFLSMTGDDEELEMISDLRERLFRRTLELGGTLTGEHGIGSHKGQYLGWEFDDATVCAMHQIKDVFDPHQRFNRGKVFSVKKT